MSLKSYLFAVLAGIGLASESLAQSQETESSLAADPIVTMLDSLVTLNNVIRYNASLENVSAINLPALSDNEVQARMDRINSPIPLTYNTQVKNYIDLYAVKKPALTSRVLGLSKLYFPLFEQTLDKHKLPLEFKYLSVVESALNPVAVSPVGATGIWQFMYQTGKLYDLNISSYVDDRRNPLLATEAACKYFKDMYDIYGDWLLVIAAYNCGAGNVNKAIVRAGGRKNFWDISRFLPRETRGYVPAFIAATYVMYYANELNIQPVTPAFSFYDTDTVTVRTKLTFTQLSKILDVPVDVISFLNPTFKRNVIPASSEICYKLSLPANRISLYVSNEQKIASLSQEELQPKENLTSEADYEWKEVKKWYTVRKGETLKQFAHRTSCAMSDVKSLNKLRSTKIYKGQKLQVYALVKVKKTKPPVAADDNTLASVTKTDTSSAKEKDAGVTGEVSKEKIQAESQSNSASIEIPHGQVEIPFVNSDNEKKSDAQARYIYHTVQPGDTLWNIAKKYEGVTVEQIKALNNLSTSGKIKVGVKLRLPANG